MKEKKNIYSHDPEQWVEVVNVRERNGKMTPHPQEAGLRFQLKQLEFWRKFFAQKYGHNVYITFNEIK